MERTEANFFFFVITDFKIYFFSFQVSTRLQRSLLVPYLSNKFLSGDAQSIFIFSPFWPHLTKGVIGLLLLALNSFTMQKKGTICCQEAAKPLSIMNFVLWENNMGQKRGRHRTGQANSRYLILLQICGCHQH